jgi:hypothetical protein
MARNLWVAYPRATDNEIDNAIAEFEKKGGKVKKLRVPDKNFRETPREKGAIFLSDREERLLDD